ncbi:uncharacterized protein MELLADRAFT_59925 [Melampsora larici-populina 98AG31]|uniref:Uncharacterized protein n=1 Tax=Melampsora larici-populina (strain 98AG31 / pathotype 3-4-7) TaxID=747676 RepID=F4R9A8_MELLP|nr:uncharacterized protein MELLADRAFT_59925 [Melampsora larici-populina 98AG31]EGG10953.1 hypothetical protein MELLADRAFT_59925 [Melampsora larici-populina 98AG31]
MPPKIRVPPRRRPGSDPVNNAIKHFNDVQKSCQAGKRKLSQSAEEDFTDELGGNDTPEAGDTESTEIRQDVKLEAEEERLTADPPIQSLEYDFTVEENPEKINYWTLRRLIRKDSMYDYLNFAGLDSDQINLVIPMLREKEVTNWDLFLFRDYISVTRLQKWGIPEGICV